MTEDELRIQALRLAIEAKAADIPAEAAKILAFLRAPPMPKKARKQASSNPLADLQRARSMMEAGATGAAAARAAGYAHVSGLFHAAKRHGFELPRLTRDDPRVTRMSVALAARRASNGASTS